MSEAIKHWIMRISIILHGMTEVLHKIYANGNPEIT